MSGRSRTSRILLAFLILFSLGSLTAVPARAVATSFTYQGQLTVDGTPADGTCDLQFSLFAAASGGAALATVGPLAVSVDRGLFTVPLDFGANFPGADRWLQISADCPGSDPAVLAPRQRITAAPYALYANTSGTIPDASVTGAKIADGSIGSGDLTDGAVTSAKIASNTITDSDIDATKVQRRVTATCAAATALNQVNSDGTVGCVTVGDITAVTAGSGLSGGATTGNATLNVAVPLALSGAVTPGAVISATNTGVGVLGTSTQSIGVHGMAQAGGADGVRGTASGSGGSGVHGIANSGTAVYGESINGFGVYARSDNGTALWALSLAGVGLLGASTQSIGIHGTTEASADAVRGTANGSNGNGVHGIANNGSAAYGVYGESTNGYGVWAKSDNGTGVRAVSTAGVGLLASSTQNFGIHGTTEADYGAFAGVRGTSTGLNSNGVSGEANNGPTAYGVVGSSTSGVGVYGNGIQRTGVSGKSEGVGSQGDGVLGTALGVNGNGVHGVANNGTGAYAVWGESTSGFAGYFHGKVSVTGTLTKGGGSFKIDHPLDPANKYLSHSFVESPDMKNMYDGIAVLDDGGRADVELPDWFEALNRDFRYQLTCLGAFAPVYVAEEIHDNRFRIAGGTPGQKISWLITGTRQDAYANAHRVVVEEEKPAPEAGRYLHPVEHGMPESLNVSAAKDSASPQK